MSKISAVLLAAGESRRMRGLNKLELMVAGVPLLRRTATTLLAAPLEEVVVVFGHEFARAQALVRDLPLNRVYNGCYQEGQMTSVHAGLDALSRPCDGIMVCLTDQPLLEVTDIEAIIGAFARRRRGSILVPTYGGKRGNPIVLAASHRDDIMNGGRNLGCKHLIENNPESVETVEMENDHVICDLDTPEDYANLQRRLGPPVARPATTADASRTRSTV